MNCMNFRRVVPKNNINHSYGNTCTNFALSVPNVNQRMTIYETNKQFRSTFNILKENDWFYKEYLNQVDFYHETIFNFTCFKFKPIKHSKIIQRHVYSSYKKREFNETLFSSDKLHKNQS